MLTFLYWQLHIGDLNSVSCTCRTLNEAFLAKLYSRVAIKVPIRWSRLVSLENLLSSTGSGLKFTTDICITAHQQPSNDDTMEVEDERTTSEIQDERESLFCLPKISASKALNVMIRLLLMRIPESHLKLFECAHQSIYFLGQKLTVPDSWRHSCTLETSTLALLFDYQGATLRGLSVTRYTEPQSVYRLLVGGLKHLVITDLNLEQRCEWPSELIARNRDTLRHLHLGMMNRIAHNYITDDNPIRLELPTSFREVAKVALSANERGTVPISSLETLGLYGLSLENIIKGALGFDIDFSSMTTLRLESCWGLENAFALLMGKNGFQNTPQSVLRLTSFFIRDSDGTPMFARHLAAFLTSFTGLTHLGLLLEGQSKAMNKAPILKMHGKTLQTLIWHERRCPRVCTRTDPSLFSKDNNLELISINCPNLIALGLAVNWGSRLSSSIPLVVRFTVGYSI